MTAVLAASTRPALPAASALRAGTPVVVIDPRRDTGELVLPAHLVTPHALAQMVRLSSGFVCVALPGVLADTLELPPMTTTGRLILGGVPTVAVDSAEGVSTGISATDRAHTIGLLADPATGPDDLQRPGHVIPIRVVEGDTPEASPVAAAAALAVLTGGPPVAALSGVVSVIDPCRMADADELLQIARRTGLAAVTTSALAAALRP